MDGEMLTYGDQLVAALERAVALGEQLPGQRFRLSGDDLARVLPLLDRCRAVMEGDTYAIAAEAELRGEVAASQAGSTANWVSQHCPSLDRRQAAAVAKAVKRLAPPRFAQVHQAVMDGQISPAVGVTVRAEFDAMERLLRPGSDDAVLAGLVAMGVADGSAGVRGLRPAMLARYGLAEELQDEQDRHDGCTTLTRGRDIGGGLHEYRLRLGPEQRAVVEAAIGALSAPRPCTGHPDRGDHTRGPECRDPRTLEQRRGDALVEVCRRATAATPATTAAGTKVTVFVTIRWDDLRDGTGPGTVFAGLDDGTLLGPQTVRKMACDAGIIPVVLGSRGEILDLGHTVRLFTPGQVKALWLRDRHCTFDGCTIPATWCHAHHIRHWADAGPTDLANAALLCARHHTIVHRDRLTAQVTPDGIRWDTVPGSYDRAPCRSPNEPPERPIDGPASDTPTDGSDPPHRP